MQLILEEDGLESSELVVGQVSSFKKSVNQKVRESDTQGLALIQWFSINCTHNEKLSTLMHYSPDMVLLFLNASFPDKIKNELR